MNLETNPVLCSLPEAGLDVGLLLSTVVEVTLAWVKMHKTATLVMLAASLLGAIVYRGTFTPR